MGTALTAVNPTISGEVIPQFPRIGGPNYQVLQRKLRLTSKNKCYFNIQRIAFIVVGAQFGGTFRSMADAGIVIDICKLWSSEICSFIEYILVR